MKRFMVYKWEQLSSLLHEVFLMQNKIYFLKNIKVYLKFKSP